MDFSLIPKHNLTYFKEVNVRCFIIREFHHIRRSWNRQLHLFVSLVFSPDALRPKFSSPWKAKEFCQTSWQGNLDAISPCIPLRCPGGSDGPGGSRDGSKMFKGVSTRIFLWMERCFIMWHFLETGLKLAPTTITLEKKLLFSMKGTQRNPNCRQLVRGFRAVQKGHSSSIFQLLVLQLREGGMVPHITNVT